MHTSQSIEWYEQSFGEDYLLVYKHRNPLEAERFIQNAIKWLGLPSGSRVLDLCCGAGRHALVLAEAGYRVTGVDLSPVLLRKARENDPAGRVRWVESDMRDLPADGSFSQSFDGVVNLFTSFGYFEQDSEQLKVLYQIRDSLKPGGLFLIDVLNEAFTRKHLVPVSKRVEGGTVITENRSIENGFVTKQIAIEEAGRSDRGYTERVKLYSLQAMSDMITEAGLLLEAVYGDYDGAAYEPEQSPRMILRGRR